MKVVLLGYMASGKSAVGKILAKDNDIQFIDLDDFIEKNEGLTISEIFEQKGEIYFRKVESEYLKNVLNFDKDCIISLGGGTPCYGNNMELVKEYSNSFYLKATVNTIFDRLKGETSKRPLVKTIGVENLQEYIGKHLFERSIFYNKAQQIITVDEKSLFEISEEIKKLF